MKFKLLGAIAGLTLPLISQTLPTAQARELSPSTTQASALLQPTLKAPLVDQVQITCCQDNPSQQCLTAQIKNQGPEPVTYTANIAYAKTECLKYDSPPADKQGLSVPNCVQSRTTKKVAGNASLTVAGQQSAPLAMTLPAEIYSEGTSKHQLKVSNGLLTGSKAFIVASDLCVGSGR